MNSTTRFQYPIALLLLFVFSWVGCSVFNSTQSVDAVATRHMNAGEGFEQTGDLGNATREYSIVASLYPNYPDYPRAVRKAASLYLDAKNPAANDSAAFSLLTLYLTLPDPETGKEEARSELSLVGRIENLTTLLSHTEQLMDSLTQVVRRQTGTLGTQAQRLNELDAELHQAKQELARLKDVDVRLSRLHRRR